MTAERPAPTPPPARPPLAAPTTPPVGLSGLRAHLDRVVERHGLRSLLVVIDDDDLGRQAFRAGTGPLEPGVAAAGPGVFSDPPLPPSELDGELLTTLCAMCLQLEVLGESAGEPDDHDELALRRLPGVYAVVLEHDGDVTLCHVLATADAPEDVARQVAEALGPSTGAKVVVELRRDPGETPLATRQTTVRPPAPRSPAPARTSVVPPQFADATWSADALALRPEPAAAPTSPRLPEPVHPVLDVVAVRSVPADGVIEVHLGLGNARSVGRAPLARGLAGASEAVLAAFGQIDESATGWTPTWVRTVETTADGRFVVAASLDAASGHHHGIAAGSSPIEGAARATAAALAEAATERASGG